MASAFASHTKGSGFKPPWLQSPCLCRNAQVQQRFKYAYQLIEQGNSEPGKYVTNVYRPLGSQYVTGKSSGTYCGVKMVPSCGNIGIITEPSIHRSPGGSKIWELNLGQESLADWTWHYHPMEEGLQQQLNIWLFSKNIYQPQVSLYLHLSQK